jgi:hypothetical protein
MKGRTRYFTNYTKMAWSTLIEPAAVGKPSPPRIPPAKTRLAHIFRVFGARETTGPGRIPTGLQFNFKIPRAQTKDLPSKTRFTQVCTLYSVFSIDSRRSHRSSTTAVDSRLSHLSSTSTDSRACGRRIAHKRLRSRNSRHLLAVLSFFWWRSAACSSQ